MKISNKAGFLLIFSLIMVNFSLIMIEGEESEDEMFFPIYFLSPNTSSVRQQMTLLMYNQLPKIGIEAIVPWEPGPISVRTWSYPFIEYDYIPEYNLGGYDILFTAWSFGVDWNPTGLFDTASLAPLGDNFYQYSNPEFDSKLSQYMSTHNLTLQKEMIHDMQDILYEDLPSIVLVYPKSLYGFKETIEGVNTLLLAESCFNAETWDDPGDNIIKQAIPADLKEWNIFVQESYYDHMWMQSVYGKLFRRNEITREWENALATDYEVSSDGLNFTVDIDPNAKFSDGSTVLAEDVEYTLELHMNPAVGSSSYSYYHTWFTSNSSVTAIDADTIQFNMSQINAFARRTLSFGIIDKSVVQPLIGTYGYSIFNEVPFTGNVGDALVRSCGPFVLDSFDTINSVVKMVPNLYWDDSLVSGGSQPLLDELYFMFISGKDTAVAQLIAGNVDIVDAQYYPELEDFTPAGVEARSVHDPSLVEMVVNQKHPIIGTGELTPNGTAEAGKFIRKAMSHIVPRDVIVNTLLEGLGSPGVSSVPPSSVGFNELLEPYEYNLTLAKEYMEKAGYEYEEETTSKTGIINIIIFFIMFIGLASFSKAKKLRKRT
jgi:ABC-type transport system substrate-binding protein